MSWALQYKSLADYENNEPAYPFDQDGAVVEVKEQITAAREAADVLIASKKVGGEGKDFYINLSGHANPSHEPTPGWANDTITVSVTQK